MSTDTEQPLVGGMVNAVVRVGDTVRRTSGPWTPAVHSLLEHLASVGFRYSPLPLGIDDSGREILTFLPGETSLRPWPAIVASDDGMSQMAGMVAELRAAVRTFPTQADQVWRTGGVPGREHREIRHGDVGPWNMLWDGDRLVGLIDWEFAEPAPALWDFAQLAWYAVPLSPDPQAWRDCGFPEEPDYLARVDIICEHAGCSRPQLTEALLDLLACERERIGTWGAADVHPFDSFLERGFITETDTLITWLQSRPL